MFPRAEANPLSSHMVDRSIFGQQDNTVTPSFAKLQSSDFNFTKRDIRTP